MLGIAKLFKVSAVAVLKWVKNDAKSIDLPQEGKAEIVQIDELWHFVNGKNTLWIWRAIDGISCRSIGWHLGRRSDADLSQLLEHVDDSLCDFVTDEWGGFFGCLDEKRHFYGKDLTVPIKATNSDVRHRRTRFKRKTKASSKSLDMVQLSLNLFHHLQDYPHNVAASMAPLLSFFTYKCLQDYPKCSSFSYSNTKTLGIFKICQVLSWDISPPDKFSLR